MLAIIKRNLPLPFVGTYDQAVEADERSAHYGRYEADTLMTERYVNILWGIGFALVALTGIVWWAVA